MSRMDPRRGLAVGDALLVLSVLALGLALAYPRIRRAALRDHIEQAVAHVQTVVDAAERFQGEQDRWPDLTATGEIPAELAAYLPPGFSFSQDGYQLDFDVWETAEEAPTVEPPEPRQPLDSIPDTIVGPPTTLYGSLAGVTVHSPEALILAGLLDHFGGSRSFLHAGRWTLVFASVPAR